jgi:hypothetical protein
MPQRLEHRLGALASAQSGRRGRRDRHVRGGEQVAHHRASDRRARGRLRRASFVSADGRFGARASVDRLVAGDDVSASAPQRWREAGSSAFAADGASARAVAAAARIRPAAARMARRLSLMWSLRVGTGPPGRYLRHGSIVCKFSGM